MTAARLLPKSAIRAVLLAALLVPLAAASASAAAGSASQFIETLGAEAIKVAADTAKTRNDKSKEFRTLLKRGFDLPRIGRFVMGRYWRQISDAQKERYAALFEDYLVATYTNRFNEYSGETFEVIGEKPHGERGTLVTTKVFRPQGAEVVVDWQVIQEGDTYRIVDVIIEGLSMSLTQRSDFASAIQSQGGNLDRFLDALERKVKGQN